MITASILAAFFADGVSLALAAYLLWKKKK